MNDEQLLAAIPDHVSFETLLKARPVTEGGERIIYVEASKEAKDQQDEIVLSKALKESADHFLKFGVLDIDHKSMPPVARRLGIERPEEWAIGQPLDVGFTGDMTFVKAQLYQGDTPLVRRANDVWDGMTKVNPPVRYYASVGGAVLEKSVEVNPETNERVAVISKVRWNNLALSLSPVNQHLDSASAAPIGTFCKSLNGFVVKTLEAGYGTDSASLTGGAALRRQSLHGTPVIYPDFREELARFLNGIRRIGRDASIGDKEVLKSLVDRSVTRYGIGEDEASELVERFFTDLNPRSFI
jgi:hypothetical protein